MANRLPIDAQVLGYWGFDEANASDPALDESTKGVHLTVTAASAVVAARVGNGRQFDGTNTIAAPIGTSDPLRVWMGRGTIIVWVTLDSMNQAGDQLRPILTLHGAGGTLADAGYGLYVDSQGRVVFRYTGNHGEDCFLRSAASTVRTGRYYSLAVTCEIGPIPPDGHSGLIATLYVNNEPAPWALFTVDGVQQPNPNAEGVTPAPAGQNAVLRVGGTVKNTSRWHGVIDELSIHGIPRTHVPYLHAAYFRLTLATSFNALTMVGSVRTLGSAEMGGGTRWWCYERDQSIYVIRENSLGLFGQEVQLTSGGLLANGAPMPAGVEKPRLAYDPVSDTLVIVFVGAGKVWKVTTASVDVPVTLVMPYTQDTATIVKVRDSLDIMRNGVGETNATVHPGVSGGVGIPTDQYPATIAFLGPPHHASFGVAVYGPNPYGYKVYSNVGGEETLIAVCRGAYQTSRVASPAYWFAPIATRIDGARYYARMVDAGGVAGRTSSNVIEDRLGQPVTGRDGVFDRITLNRDGDAVGGVHEAANFGGGETVRMHEYPVMVVGTPVKIGLTPEAFSGGAGEAGLYKDWAFVFATPVKQAVLDAATLGAGDGGKYVTMQRSDLANVGIA